MLGEETEEQEEQTDVSVSVSVADTANVTDQSLTGRARSLANLKPPWKPGERPAGAGGRKGWISLSDKIQQELMKLDPKTGESYHTLLARAMVRGAITSAIRGHDAMARTILERLEGKVPDVVDLRALDIVLGKDIESMTIEELDEFDRQLKAVSDKLLGRWRR